MTRSTYKKRVAASVFGGVDENVVVMHNAIVEYRNTYNNAKLGTCTRCSSLVEVV